MDLYDQIDISKNTISDAKIIDQILEEYNENLLEENKEQIDENDLGIIYQNTGSEGQIIEIDKKSELFFLLTRMQDEVHRYAISFHKNVRSKSLFQSVLDDVSGIGPKRKKELLKHFGSVKKLKEASLEQLQQHLPKEVAKELFETLSHTK